MVLVQSVFFLLAEHAVVVSLHILVECYYSGPRRIAGGTWRPTSHWNPHTFALGTGTGPAPLGGGE